jgi:hypothetical protein
MLDQVQLSEEGTAVGWVAFAGVALLLLALLNATEGIAAISGSQFFGKGELIIGDLTTFGWILCAIAAVQLVVAPLIWMNTAWARLAGVAIAAVDAVVQMLFIPAYPLWSLAIFGVSLLVIYALAVHPGTAGGRS